MEGIQTLHSLLQQSLVKQEDRLDMIDSRFTVIELNDSDLDAVFLYISHVIRRILGTHSSYHVYTIPDANRPSDNYEEDDLIASQSNPVLYLDKEDVCQDGQVVILDQLLAFDVKHFAKTIPSQDILDQIKILREPDPLISFGKKFICFNFSNKI